MPVFMTYFSRFWEALLKQFKELLPAQKNLSEEILHAIDYGPRFVIHPFGLNIRISDAMISLVFASLVIVLMTYWMTKKRELRPGSGQTLGEMFFSSIESACASMGLKPEHSKHVVPYVASLGLLITFSNLSSLFKLKPASLNPSVPITLAVIDLVYILVMGIRFVGVRGFLGSLMQPTPVLLPFKLLDYVIKPVSLAFRLFGNIFGAFILMTFIEVIVPLVLPSVLALWFDLGDGIIQGLVFGYLTINYLGEIVEGAESAEHARAARIEKKKKKTA